MSAWPVRALASTKRASAAAVEFAGANSRDRARDPRGQSLRDTGTGHDQRARADARCSTAGLGHPSPPPGPIETAVNEDDGAGGPDVCQADELEFADQRAGARNQSRGAHRPQGRPDGPGRAAGTKRRGNATAQPRKGIH